MGDLLKRVKKDVVDPAYKEAAAAYGVETERESRNESRNAAIGEIRRTGFDSDGVCWTIRFEVGRHTFGSDDEEEEEAGAVAGTQYDTGLWLDDYRIDIVASAGYDSDWKAGTSQVVDEKTARQVPLEQEELTAALKELYRTTVQS